MTSHTIQSDLLKQYVARIENIEEEKAKIQEDLKEVYSNAKNHGFDIKILKHVVKLRKMDSSELAEQEAILDLYRNALGMYVSSNEDE